MKTLGSLSLPCQPWHRNWRPRSLRWFDLEVYECGAIAIRDTSSFTMKFEGSPGRRKIWGLEPGVSSWWMKICITNSMRGFDLMRHVMVVILIQHIWGYKWCFNTRHGVLPPRLVLIYDNDLEVWWFYLQLTQISLNGLDQIKSQELAPLEKTCFRPWPLMECGGSLCWIGGNKFWFMRGSTLNWTLVNCLIAKLKSWIAMTCTLAPRDYKALYGLIIRRVHPFSVPETVPWVALDPQLRIGWTLVR